MQYLGPENLCDAFCGGHAALVLVIDAFPSIDLDFFSLLHKFI